MVNKSCILKEDGGTLFYCFVLLFTDVCQIDRVENIGTDDF